VRDALARDWAQTKADLHKKTPQDLRQTVRDTVRQAVGVESIPPALKPNRGELGDRNWTYSEPAVRYGFGAREHHGAHTEWNGELEANLRRDWAEMNTFRSWDDAKGDVRCGWDAYGTGA
jgi:hypothetical protein